MWLDLLEDATYVYNRNSVITPGNQNLCFGRWVSYELTLPPCIHGIEQTGPNSCAKCYTALNKMRSRARNLWLDGRIIRMPDRVSSWTEAELLYGPMEIEK